MGIIITILIVIITIESIWLIYFVVPQSRPLVRWQQDLPTPSQPLPDTETSASFPIQTGKLLPLDPALSGKHLVTWRRRIEQDESKMALLDMGLSGYHEAVRRNPNTDQIKRL